VSSLDDPFCFRIPRPQHQHLRREGAAEGLALDGELVAAAGVLTDRTLTVPDQHPRHRAQPGQVNPPAAVEVLRAAGRDQPREQHPRIPAHHRQHRQLLGGARLTAPDRQLDVGEPEVVLRDLPSNVGSPRGRVRRQIRPPQLGHPTTEHPDRTRPPDPLRDHRRRHRRTRPQQLPDPRLDHVHDRPRRPALILRRPVAGQRGIHRVPRHAQHPRNLRDRHLLRPRQPADLCPILHAQHLLPPRLGSSQGHGASAQFSDAAPCSVFRCRRQRAGFAAFAVRML
jgi:hypothetical protein